MKLYVCVSPFFLVVFCLAGAKFMVKTWCALPYKTSSFLPSDAPHEEREPCSQAQWQHDSSSHGLHCRDEGFAWLAFQNDSKSASLCSTVWNQICNDIFPWVNILICNVTENGLNSCAQWLGAYTFTCFAFLLIWGKSTNTGDFFLSRRYEIFLLSSLFFMCRKNSHLYI